jgi:hypothetical protein
MRLSENSHLPFDKPFDKLTVLSSVKGLRYRRPSSLRRTALYTSFLGASSRSRACGMDIFHQPLRGRAWESLCVRLKHGLSKGNEFR